MPVVNKLPQAKAEVVLQSLSEDGDFDMASYYLLENLYEFDVGLNHEELNIIRAFLTKTKVSTQYFELVGLLRLPPPRPRLELEKTR